MVNTAMNATVVRKLVSVRLSDELIARVDAYAAKMASQLKGVSFERGDAIRNLLEHGLDAVGEGEAGAKKTKAKKRT